MAAVMAEYATLMEPLGPRCSPSKAFKVKNIDDKGRIIHIGFLEVSEIGIIFTYEHHPNESTQWPLNCIRKYGVNPVGNLFALEVGRRAPTGEGTYAFRTDDAEEIQRTLDYYISGQNKMQARTGILSWQR